MIVIAAIIAAAVGIATYQFWPPAARGVGIQPSACAGAFQIESTATQKTIDNDALKGQWTLLFTGYTFCPDICPTTIRLTTYPAEIAAPTDTVNVWLISVDPKRDSLERLTQYTGYFGDAFVGVRAEHPQLFPFVQDLGLMYSIPEEGEENYLVNHSAAIILVDPDGHRKAIFNADHKPGEIPLLTCNS